jgi:glyoxylase-like metal-dependent hydrolase (beta-lactamase superfamily II)
MKRSVLLGLLLATGAASIAAQAPTGSKSIDILKLKDNFYVLTSSTPGDAATFSGGNVAVFITDGGVTLVDDKLAGWGQAVLDKVKGVTDKPITRIINTHTHGDHTGNNGFFGASVEIIAQENTKTNMAKMDAFKGDNARFLPRKTFPDKMSLGSGKDRIDLYYFGAAHTNGDAFVVFPALRILHTGDAFAWKDGPGCDRNNGGSCVSFPRTLQRAVAALKDIDTVIPGHSPVQTPKDLETYQKFTAAFLSHAIDAMKAGKSVDDATASFAIDKFPGYKKERLKASIQAVYDELKK